MQNNTIKLEVSLDELNVIMSGVIKLPIEVGLNVFNKIDQQAKQQLNANNPAPTGPLANKVVN